MIEVPKWNQDLRSRIKVHNNLYTSSENKLTSGNRLNSTHSRHKLIIDQQNISEFISRNNSNIVTSSSIGSKSQQKRHKDNHPLIDRPVRTLREVFKSIKKEIK